MALKLYDFQEEGAWFLASRQRALLADRMGLGKTVQAITAARQVGANRTTVVCPASAKPQWAEEWERWGGPGDVTFHSYMGLIRRDNPPAADVVILDEAHYCKNPDAKRTQAALGLAAASDRAWLLTGTPMPNNPTELWPMFKWLWPDMLKEIECHNAAQWMFKFCKTYRTNWGYKPYGVRNGAVLRGMLERVMLRRTLDDVGISLPPIRMHLMKLPRSKAAVEALQEYEAAEVDENLYTSTLRRILGRVKSKTVAKQVVQELQDNEYEKIIIMYHHKEVATILASTFVDAGFSVAGISGSTSQKDRGRMRRLFQEDPNFRVFLGQQTSAGVALNLTAAQEMILLEPAWSPEDNRQAIARMHRIGQDSPCRVRLFAIDKTLDDAVLTTLRTKMQMQDTLHLT